MLTGWLSELDESDEDELMDSDSEAGLAPGTFTNWLVDNEEVEDAEFPAHESEEEEPEPGTLTGWLADTNEPEEGGLTEEEFETGQFTDWLAM